MLDNYILKLFGYDAEHNRLHRANGQQIVMDMYNSRIVVFGGVKSIDCDL